MTAQHDTQKEIVQQLLRGDPGCRQTLASLLP
jgi:hypothetical protein